MDKLTTLAISYPDFQLNQIIDPEQMDLNNLQIVNKINNIIKSFNELIQGTSGAGNITIAPIPEFSDATTVQQALQQIAMFVKTLDADAKRQFAELVQKNSQQDTEIQSIKSVNTQQDSRLQSLESTQTNHTQRIGAIEQKNTSQDNEINAIKQKNNEQDGRLTTAEGTINTHTSQIQSINAKDTEQDRRISGIESREELDTAFVNNIEKRVGVNETDIQKLQEDFAQLEGKDPVAELVVARTSGHTQETFRTLGDRLDHNEIPVKTDFTGQLRGAVNFRVVDENTTETWENHVKLGDITAHDESPIAHEVMMAEHEMDETSHNDIREKIIGLGEKDLELDKKINVLENDRGYLNSFMSGADLNTFTQNGIYAYSQLSANKPSQSFGYLFVSDWGKGYCRQFVQDSENTCYTRLLDNNVWGEWRQLATSEQINDLSGMLDKLQVQKITSGTHTLSDYKEQGIYCFSSATTITDIPVGSNGWLIVLPSTTPNATKQLWLRWGSEPNFHQTFVRYISHDNIYEWREYATTTKTDISFPFTGSYMSRGGYVSKVTKDAMGLVTINVTFQINDGTTPLPQGNNIIGTLPVGYRPQGIVAGVGSTAFGGTMINVRVTVDKDGVVVCTTGNDYTGSNVIGFSISYYV